MNNWSPNKKVIIIRGEKITHEDFLKRLEERNPSFLEKIEVIGRYNGCNSKIKLRCKKCGKEFERVAGKISKGNGSCPNCDKGRNQYKVFDTKVFIEEFNKVNIKDIKILGEYKNMHIKIECECKNGHKFLKTPDKLLQGQDCPYCCNKKPLKGFNTFGDKFPWLVKYFKNSEDAFKYTPNSGENVFFKCPVCGYEDKRRIATIASSGYFHCKICGDFESLPNKFIRAVLEYKKDILDYYEFEYKPEWANGKYRYDAYFEYKGNKYIVEMQGLQHFTNRMNSKFKPNRNEQENDKNKRELALKNGIKYYIEILAYKTSIEYLNKEFNKTILKDIFKFTEKELIEIHKLIQTSLFGKVVELYNNDKKVMEIVRKLSISDSTVTKYLKKANELGLSEYQPQTNGRKGLKVPKAIKVKAINIDTKKEEIFNSKKSLIRKFKDDKNITIEMKRMNKSIKNKEEYKGYIFEELLE